MEKSRDSHSHSSNNNKIIYNKRNIYSTTHVRTHSLNGKELFDTIKRFFSFLFFFNRGKNVSILRIYFVWCISFISQQCFTQWKHIDVMSYQGSILSKAAVVIGCADDDDDLCV